MQSLSEELRGNLDELVYWYWLSKVPYLGPHRFKRLLTLFDNDLAKVSTLRREQLLCIRGIDDKIATAIVNSKENMTSYARDIARLKEKASALGTQLLKLTDPEYPNALRETTASPPILFTKGQISRANDSVGSIAIVGTRNVSEYGLAAARQVAKVFASEKWAVISGMAKGVDIAAHWGALEAEGFTVGVLGCGLDVLYPQGSSEVRRRAEEQGAVISEYAFGMRPSDVRLKKRNKITVGMAQAVIVIETALKGGTMNAVRAAKEQRKPIFAVSPPVEVGFEGNRHLISTGEAIELSPDFALRKVSEHLA